VIVKKDENNEKCSCKNCECFVSYDESKEINVEDFENLCVYKSDDEEHKNNKTK
jgi:hypothetical protein